jgi:hypothetical protein
MPTFSKYVTDEDIAQARQTLAEIDDELREVDLAEKAGNDVTALRQTLNDSKAKLNLFITTYNKVEETRSSRRVK